MGFEKIYISKFNNKGIMPKAGIEIVMISKIEELYRVLF